MELKNKTTNVTHFILLIFPLFLISSFNSNSSQLKEIGTISILLILIISAFFLIRHLLLHKAVEKTLLTLLIPIATLFVVLTLSLLVQPDLMGISNLAKFLGAMSLLLFFSLINWTPLRIKIVFYFSFSTLLIMPFITDIASAGPYYAFILFFILASEIRNLSKFILFLICFYLIYLSDARAVTLLVLTALFTYFIWNIITKYKGIFILYLMSILTALMAFIFIYPNLIYYRWFQTLNFWFIENTGARLNSGRDVIWAKLTESILEYPFLGHGLGSSASMILNTRLSSHNLYIQMSLQSGLIALAIYLMLLITIWSVYFKSRKDRLTRLSASFFVGILVYSSFEVVLLQNKMDTATMFWLIISIGISRTIYRNTNI